MKHELLYTNVLKPTYTKGILKYMSIHQMRPVGLGVLSDNSSGWVGTHKGRRFFHAAKYFLEWTTSILVHHEATLKDASIYNVVWAFKDRFELANREVIRAII